MNLTGNHILTDVVLPPDRLGTASIISADRVVFNINGNDYRLVAAVDRERGIVWITDPRG